MHPDAARRTLRLAFGTAFCLWFSQVVAWPLSFVAPILTLVFLSAPKPPGVKQGIGAIVLVGVALYASLLLLPLLLHVQTAGILVMTVILFHAFYIGARGGPAVIGTLITVLRLL